MFKKAIKSKIALITGGGSGIGRSLAMEFARQGARVVITDILPERVEAVVGELSAMGCEAQGYTVDHTDEDGVRRFYEKYKAEHKDVDYLCLNAGIGLGMPLENMTLADWKRVIDINLWGAVYMADLFLPPMGARGSGSLMITASIAGLVSFPAMSAYCASKYAMVGMAESLRMEYKTKNVHVTALCPGLIKTNIVNDGFIRLETKHGDGRDQERIKQVFEKFGTSPDTVARAAVRGMRRKKATVISPRYTYLQWYFKRFSNSLYLAVVGRVWGREKDRDRVFAKYPKGRGAVAGGEVREASSR